MEIFESFHPIYIIFPLILAILCLVRETKTKVIIITVLYIIFFVCAETGADYINYEMIYKECFSENVHGEIGYILLCRCCVTLKLSYNLFRVLFLTLFTILFVFSVYKLSNKFTLSFLLVFIVYPIYLVSAYRQFATIAIFLFSLYLFLVKEKKFLAIIFNVIAVFFHTMAIFQFVLLLVLYFYEKSIGTRKNIERVFLKKYIFHIITICVIIRLSLFVILVKTPIGKFIERLVSYKEFSLINLGFVSRVFEMVLLTNLYCISTENKNIDLMFSLYFIGLILYLLIPAELIMGRLINNIRFLSVILIPKFLFSYNKDIHSKNLIIKITTVLIVIYVCVFTAQLINQEGYTLIHMIWGE